MKLYRIMFGMPIPDKLKKNDEGEEIKWICIPEEQYKICYADYGSGQSMERIIERGGFGLLELVYYYGKDKWDHIVYFGYGNKYPEHIWEWRRVKFTFPTQEEWDNKKSGYSWEIINDKYPMNVNPRGVQIFKEVFQYCLENYDNTNLSISRDLCKDFVEHFDNVIKEKNWW